MWPRWRTCAGVAALTLAVLAGCGDDDDDAAQRSTTTTTSESETTTTTAQPETTTTAPASPEALAIAAYERSQTVLSEALGSNPPNPQHPDIPKVFTGQARTDTVQIIVDTLQRNEYTQTTARVQPKVESATTSEVVLTDCLEETYQSFSTATGQPTTSGSTTYNFHVTVVLEQGAWKVASIEPQEEPCTP